MKNIFVDTNLLIDYSKKYTQKLGLLLNLQQVNQACLYINPIVVAEYFNDKNLSDKNKVVLAKKFLQLFPALVIDVKDGITVGELLRTNKISFIGDAFIAATCLNHNLILATNNEKDFKKVRELNFYHFD